MKKPKLSHHMPMLLRRAAALLRAAPAVENEADLPVVCDGAEAALHTARTIIENGGDA